MANNKKLPQVKTVQSIQQPKVMLLLLLVLLPFIGSCSKPAAEDLWQDYHSRLARVLDLPELQPELAAVPPLPPVRELYQTLAENKLTLLDLVALRSCGLQQLVAERNNSLGKTMTPANQLGYELQLLHQLQPCLQHPALDSGLRAQLAEIYRQKQQELPVVVDNFFLTDHTLRQQLQGSQRSLQAGETLTVAPTMSALRALADMQYQLHRLDNKTIASTNAGVINQQVGQLYQSQLLADWQYSLRLNYSWLKALNQQLEHFDLDKFCQRPQAKPKAEILRNILLQQFIGKIQPYLAELDGISQQLQPLLNRMYQHSAIKTAFYQRTEAQNMALKIQLRRHVAWWQQLQQQCQVKIASKQG